MQPGRQAGRRATRPPASMPYARQTPGRRLFARAPVKISSSGEWGLTTHVQRARSTSQGQEPRQAALARRRASCTWRARPSHIGSIRHTPRHLGHPTGHPVPGPRYQRDPPALLDQPGIPELEPGIIHRAPHSRTAIEPDEFSPWPGRCGALRPRAIHLAQANGIRNPLRSRQRTLAVMPAVEPAAA